ncbi:23S rRNA (guanosine(2251)-2'-O)-methyltransferase RlmB [Acetivibrio cellulolyticus]|uniref:23S rRNA (guanosine(2251)-2'-O)-methyltransferase RlmB n=1 Tax=Acetivibrio cellulolyticus TaxID=35830 RepID=UPI0001E2D17A|nr:23S rRNA (guanosine(2251)-2'-O)-methyltransferase RlmB [Acetivibrio cellulolyticus]
MNFISSSQNPVIKEIKALKEKKYRDQTGLFFIEGIRFVEEALKEKIEISKILVSDKLADVHGGKEILEQLENSNCCNVYTLTNKLYMEVTDTENPQGILAILNKKSISLESVYDNKNFFLVLDSLQDPGNMGTIIRTADAAGVTGVIVSKGCVDVYNPKVLRSTMGSLFHIPICYSENILQTLEEMKNKGIRLCAAHLSGSKNYFELDYKDNIAIIVGNEANGISDSVAGISNELVRIPMAGKSESLNASVAAGLLMYEVLRLRMKG